jgi:hypothetical protein
MMNANRLSPLRAVVRVAIAAVVLSAAAPAEAQLDPLLSLKRVPPNVVVVVDTSMRMLDDGTGDYYDPLTYTTSLDPNVATVLGVPSAALTYRRKYIALNFENIQDSSTKFEAEQIVTVPSTAANYAAFWAATRLEQAKGGILTALHHNDQFVRWGLMKLRQNSPAWRTPNNCDRPVRITNNAVQAGGPGDSNPCNAGGGFGLGGARFAISVPEVANSNFDVTAPAGTLPAGTLMVGLNATSPATAATSIKNKMTGLPTQDATGLIPGGRDTRAYQDRPLALALRDARTYLTASTTAAIASDPLKHCRNTVVVLVAGGKDDGDVNYTDTYDVLAEAQAFGAGLNFGGGVTRKVPIVVIGLKPASGDETELQAIAAASGGRYFRAASQEQVAAALNYAVQLGYQQPVDFDAARASEYTFTSPIVGTVNLVNAQSAAGGSLPDTDIQSEAGATQGQPLPQRSNVLITAGFGLPGFDGRVRAFRVYKPERDSTKPAGWRFVQDGTKLWPDLDGRPWLAGMARAIKCPDAQCTGRNVYTFIPNGAGGGQVVSFDLSQASALLPHLGGADPNVLVPFIRSQPIGAVIGSTPALMDPPSLDPPPDAEYGFPNSTGTYAGDYKDRRAMLFFGANDGMIHAVDARTGYEVWAFIPYNLLPKLGTLMRGQSVEQFSYFVDSSPKIAEVKMSGTWRTMMIIGQSYGGTFYQAFDVTNAGMGVPPTADGLSAVNQVRATFDSPDESIQFKWAFPNYSSFDPNINASIALTDGFPGGRVRFYGDLKITATDAERSVGFTFSDPAVGALDSARTVNGVITGSGYFPDVETNAALLGRAVSPVRAGRSFYVLDLATGKPIGNPNGPCSSAGTGTGCLDLGDVNNSRKNALQADVTAAGDANSNVVTTAYAGDIDGRYRRFNLQATGSIASIQLHDAAQPIYSSSALLFVGTSQRYLFFSTGSDLLAAGTPGGGSNGNGTNFKLLGVRDNTTSGTVTVSHNLSPAVKATAWPTNGERPSNAPTVAGDIVFFTTTTDSETPTCSDALAKVYAFTYLGTAAYDSDGNGKLENNESPVVNTTTGRATAPFIVDQHLFIGTTSLTGAGVTLLGDPEDFNNGAGQVGVRILSWREIR